MLKRVLLIKHSAIAALWKWRGVDVGSSVRFYGATPMLRVKGMLTIGDEATFRGGRSRSSLEVRPGGDLNIGRKTFINSGVEIVSEVSVIVGSGCLIGDDVAIQDTSFHEVDEGGSAKIAPVLIGDNVWIARRAIILPGVTIGDHAVVGAGSVVTRDVASKTVVAGNPARWIRDVISSDDFRR